MSLISLRNLTPLPRAKKLGDLLRSMAMLDAILCPDWESRYYSFNANWGRDEQMASMRNGQGDEFFALFNTEGGFLKGFVHDSPAAAAGIDPSEHYRGIPSQFAACVTEPAFSPNDVTFCIWQLFVEQEWGHNTVAAPPGGDPDGSEYLLSCLDGDAETYWQWAEEYYERDIDLDAVQAIYDLQPLTDELVTSLNPDLQLGDVKDDIREIGYPTK